VLRIFGHLAGWSKARAFIILHLSLGDTANESKTQRYGPITVKDLLYALTKGILNKKRARFSRRKSGLFDNALAPESSERLGKARSNALSIRQMLFKAIHRLIGTGVGRQLYVFLIGRLSYFSRASPGARLWRQRRRASERSRMVIAHHLPSFYRCIA